MASAETDQSNHGAGKMNSFTIPVREEVAIAFRDVRDGQTSIVHDLRGKPKAQGDTIPQEQLYKPARKAGGRLDKELIRAGRSRYPPNVKNIVIEGEASDDGGRELDMVLSPRHRGATRRSSHQPSVFAADRFKGFAEQQTTVQQVLSMTNLREHKSAFASLPRPKALDQRPDCLYGSFKANLPPKSKSQAKAKAKPHADPPWAHRQYTHTTGGAQQSLFKHRKLTEPAASLPLDGLNIMDPMQQLYHHLSSQNAAIAEEKLRWAAKTKKPQSVAGMFLSQHTVDQVAMSEEYSNLMRVVNSPSAQTVLPPVVDRRLTNSQLPQSPPPVSPQDVKARAQATTSPAPARFNFCRESEHAGPRRGASDEGLAGVPPVRGHLGQERQLQRPAGRAPAPESHANAASER